jgi:hypothetical protein
LKKWIFDNKERLSVTSFLNPNKRANTEIDFKWLGEERQPETEMQQFLPRLNSRGFMYLSCGKNNKYVFPSHEFAKIELNRIKNSKTHGGFKPIRAYECRHCGGWHLTHLELDAYKEI